MPLSWARMCSCAAGSRFNRSWGAPVVHLDRSKPCKSPQMRTIGIVVEEVAAKFGGEDPLRPLLRELLERSEAELTKLRAWVERNAE